MLRVSRKPRPIENSTLTTAQAMHTRLVALTAAAMAPPSLSARFCS